MRRVNGINRWRPPGAIAFLGYLLGCLLTSTLPVHAGTDPAVQFLSRHLSAEIRHQPQTLWVSGELREQAEKLLNHSFAALRVRYWGEEGKTAWILDEIGKEEPITIGVVVEQGKIADIEILTYRESRGGEVRYPFFTRQFQHLGLTPSPIPGLDGNIDGITGATLSVTAVKKVATLALIFHHHTPFSRS